MNEVTQGAFYMSVDEVLNEALGFFEAFRRIGFSADDLFLGSDSWQVFLAVQAQGRQFIAICGPYEGPEAELLTRWREKATWWNQTASSEEREALWNRSFARNNAFDLVTGLIRKGFDLPGAHRRLAVGAAS